MHLQNQIDDPSQICMIGEADPFLYQLLRRFTETCGLLPRHAVTGEAMMDLLQHEKPQLVILEPQLPGTLRGWEVAQWILTNPETRSIPLVICSWLDKTEVHSLVGKSVIHLQKPDLHFNGFLYAVTSAGIQTELVQKKNRDH